MRAHAAAQFTLTHFGAWRWAVRLLSLATAILAATWVVSAGSPAQAIVWPATLGGLALLLGWLLLVQPRDRPLSLRWDGQCWHLGAADAAGREPHAGEISVAVDLGNWMLLRFATDRAATPTRRHVIWVPAQRAGHEPQWHALRCAVYSPRPDAGADAAPDV